MQPQISHRKDKQNFACGPKNSNEASQNARSASEQISKCRLLQHDAPRFSIMQIPLALYGIQKLAREFLRDPEAPEIPADAHFASFRSARCASGSSYPQERR